MRRMKYYGNAKLVMIYECSRTCHLQVHIFREAVNLLITDTARPSISIYENHIFVYIRLHSHGRYPEPQGLCDCT